MWSCSSLLANVTDPLYHQSARAASAGSRENTAFYVPRENTAFYVQRENTAFYVQRENTTFYVQHGRINWPLE